MSGARLGLDYPAVETLLRVTGVDEPGRVFEDLQTMEMAALAALNAERPARGGGGA